MRVERHNTISRDKPGRADHAKIEAVQLEILRDRLLRAAYICGTRDGCQISGLLGLSFLHGQITVVHTEGEDTQKQW
ncbi:hypothetical protein D3C80_1764880 [compost metagenome]